MMVFNFILFRVKIERSVPSREESIAQYQVEQYLQQSFESFKLEAAQYPDFVSRI